MAGRRRWSVEQKPAILRDAVGPEGSVRAAIERHEAGSGAIYIRRRQAMPGALTGRGAGPTQRAGVQIAEPEAISPPPVVQPALGRIRIERWAG